MSVPAREKGSMNDHQLTMNHIRDNFRMTRWYDMSEQEATEAFDAFMAAHVRVVAAQAWDEGFDAGERDVMNHEMNSYDDACIANPYRTEESN